ncbi:hypothetical protein Aduo_019597 [Ancylostoma duodenale]
MSDEAADMKLTASAEEAPPTHWLVDFMEQVARSGKSSIPWTEVKPALLKHFEKVVSEKIRLHEKDDEDSKKIGEVDIEHCYQMVYNKIKDFMDFPVTFRRLCSILTNPSRCYSKLPTLMNALVKVVDADSIAPANPEEKSEPPKEKEKGDEKEFCYFDDAELRKQRVKKSKRGASDSGSMGRRRGRKRKESGPMEKSTPENPDHVDSKPKKNGPTAESTPENPDQIDSKPKENGPTAESTPENLDQVDSKPEMNGPTVESTPENLDQVDSKPEMNGPTVESTPENLDQVDSKPKANGPTAESTPENLDQVDSKPKDNGPTAESFPENPDQVDSKPEEAVISDVTNSMWDLSRSDYYEVPSYRTGDVLLYLARHIIGQNVCEALRNEQVIVCIFPTILLISLSQSRRVATAVQAVHECASTSFRASLALISIVRSVYKTSSGEPAFRPFCEFFEERQLWKGIHSSYQAPVHGNDVKKHTYKYSNWIVLDLYIVMCYVLF